MADEASRSKVDWVDIERQFLELKTEARRSGYPSEAEINRYKASLAYQDHIRSPLTAQLDLGYRHLIKGKDRPQALQYSFQILGVGEPDPAMPRFMRTSLTNHMEVVEKGIAQRSLTLEFLDSWGKVKFAFGIMSTILVDEEAARKSFTTQRENAIKGGDTTVQKHWYAQWLSKAGVLDDPRYYSRYDANQEIAELCFDIYRGRRKAVDYPVSWFRSLIYLPNAGDKSPIEPDSQDEECRLNRIYRDLPIDEIKEIIEHPAIGLSEVPPLSPDSYPEIQQS